MSYLCMLAHRGDQHILNNFTGVLLETIITNTSRTPGYIPGFRWVPFCLCFLCFVCVCLRPVSCVPTVVSVFLHVNSWLPLRFSLRSIYKTANCLLMVLCKIKIHNIYGCITACVSEQFGDKCTQTCHCINTPYDPIAGTCPPGGCQRGYAGRTCSRSMYKCFVLACVFKLII
jgi:hypothetical protein